MMRNSGVTVWWYERDNGEIRSRRFSAGYPFRGSFEHEAESHARDAVRMITIHDQFGDVGGQLEQLKAEAAQYRIGLTR